ncbi:MAG TPA: type II toxin-antitoxin system VapC family toxin [Gemmataceae bacterium]|jgi:PIN domain nuclease of toxin-antitoxin system|nr:type II toxin-antitoxin system VapC family toxin [Gemmataceae bacterium]
MTVLLDTHAFLWFVLNDPQLSVLARVTISDPNNVVLISPASYWELAIKISTGKYSLTEPLDVFMHRQLTANQFAVLPIQIEHAAVIASLPFHHNDPFDRMLIAQAIAENISIVGNDIAFDSYPISRLW